MKFSLCSIIAALFSISLFSQPNVDLELHANGFNLPIDIKNTGDSRLFIVERAGVIKILNSDGSTNPTPFLDIDAQVIAPGGPGDEGGLLSMAFHPDYNANGYFYVNYVNNAGNSVISRFSVSGTDPDLADASSEQIILTINQPFPNHNGGNLVFGPDGYLYIGMGDGGSGGDPGDRAQDLSTLLGKMLRIDINNGSPYSIPSGNPYANDGDANTLAEIWASGLRNPWRYAFDSLTNDLWIADVGQGSFEEINQVTPTAAGLNYGWRCYEGNSSYNLANCPPPSSFTFPVGEYSHTGNGEFKCSITGGYVYRGTEFPTFDGVYFFADFCSNEVGTYYFDGNAWQMDFHGPFTIGGIASFGLNNQQQLFVCGINSGNIFKVVDANLSVDETHNEAFKIFPNPVKELLNLSFKSNQEHNIKLFDITGKLVYLSEHLSVGDHSIDLSSFTSGIYILQISNDRQTETRKLVKE